jgi:myosin heavy subunit
MEHNPTVEQLRCAGVVAGITISRSCFPNRLPNSLVLARYSYLADPKNYPSRKTSDMTLEQKYAEDCKALLSAALQSKSAVGENSAAVKTFSVGKTKTYFRAGALEFLESKRTRGLDSQATTIQRAARGWLARNKGRCDNQRKRMEDAMREAANKADEERRAQLAREKAERMAAKQSEMQKLIDECNALERKMRQTERESLETLKAATENADKNKRALKEQEEQYKALEAQKIHARKAEKALLDKRLEENTKLIMYLKKENTKACKGLEMFRSRCNDEASNNGLLEGSHRDFSESVDFAEELAIQEKSHYGSLLSEYESAKAFNREMKDKFHSQQNQYLEEANSRLELQKCLKKIIDIIDMSKNKPNAIVSDINAIIKGVEASAKSEMSVLEEEFDAAPGEYTEAEYDHSEGLY